MTTETVPETESVSPTLLIDRAAAARWLTEHDNYLILLHAHPDGDTLGAGIGLQNILRKLGKTAYCVCPSVIPHRLAFISGESLSRDREFLLMEQLPNGFLWDYVVSVDVASPSLMGDYAIPFGEWGMVDLAIDHHGTNTLFAKQALVDADMAACAEIVFDIGKLIFGWSEEDPMPREIAAPLYAGLNTDSGAFKYNAVTPETHHRAAVLLSSGIEHTKITARLYGSRPIREVMAAKAAYADLRFFFDGQVSLVTFTEQTMEDYRLRDEDIDDVVNMIRGIQGVRIAIHIKPRGTGLFKLSLRCEPGVNVAEVCAKFGGGGHQCAAGCNIGTEEPAEAERLILEAAEEALRKADDAAREKALQENCR